MATISEEGDIPRRTIKEQLVEAAILREKYNKDEETKTFKFPRKWTAKFKQTNKAKNNESELVAFLNQKGILETPRYMKVHPGNILIHKNKAYKYDPSGRVVIQMKGFPQITIIREIDRYPFNNKDYSKLRGTESSPENDPILLKLLLQAKVAEMKKAMNKMALLIVGVILVGVIIWFFAK